jgi:hypothetical protein
MRASTKLPKFYIDSLNFRLCFESVPSRDAGDRRKWVVSEIQTRRRTTFIACGTRCPKRRDRALAPVLQIWFVGDSRDAEQNHRQYLRA